MASKWKNFCGGQGIPLTILRGTAAAQRRYKVGPKGQMGAPSPLAGYSHVLVLAVSLKADIVLPTPADQRPDIYNVQIFESRPSPLGKLVRAFLGERGVECCLQYLPAHTTSSLGCGVDGVQAACWWLDSPVDRWHQESVQVDTSTPASIRKLVANLVNWVEDSVAESNAARQASRKDWTPKRASAIAKRMAKPKAKAKAKAAPQPLASASIGSGKPHTPILRRAKGGMADQARQAAEQLSIPVDSGKYPPLTTQHLGMLLGYQLGLHLAAAPTVTSQPYTTTSSTLRLCCLRTAIDYICGLSRRPAGWMGRDGEVIVSYEEYDSPSWLKPRPAAIPAAKRLPLKPEGEGAPQDSPSS